MPAYHSCPCHVWGCGMTPGCLCLHCSMPQRAAFKCSQASLCGGVARKVKALFMGKADPEDIYLSSVSEGKARGSQGPALLTVVTSRSHLQAGPCCFSSGKTDPAHSQQLPGFERLDINDWHPVGVRHSARHWESMRAESQPVASLLAWRLERKVLR